MPARRKPTLRPGHGGAASKFAGWMPPAVVRRAIDDIAATPNFPEWPHWSERKPAPTETRSAGWREGRADEPGAVSPERLF
jgi:hypothetical protein